MKRRFVRAGELMVLALVFLLGSGAISAFGNTITVGYSGYDYKYLDDAVKAATAGDTIVVHATTPVRGDVVINKSLTIRGSGESPSIIPLTPAGVATTLLLDITTGTVTIQDLTLQPEIITRAAWPNFCPTVLRVEGSANVTLNNVEAWTRAGPLGDRGGIEVLDSATLVMNNCSVTSEDNAASLKISGSPKVVTVNSCSIRANFQSQAGVFITGNPQSVSIKGSTIKSKVDDRPIDVAIYIKDLDSKGTVTISGNQGKTQQTINGVLTMIGAIGGTIRVSDCQGNLTINNNDIAGRGPGPGWAGILVYESKNVTIKNNFIGYFGQQRKDFKNIPGIRVEGDESEVAISSNVISSNGGCGVLVKDRGAIITGSGNSIYLNCVSSKCQKESEFKNCGGSCWPCNFSWPSEF